MADWSKPTITSNYVTFVDEVKNRDIDAITLQFAAVTNPPVNSIRLLRSPVKFQEWDGAAFVDKVLSVAGGGTGANTQAGAITALGLGTISVQNANNVNISGGQIFNVQLSGAINYVGGAFSMSSAASPAITLSIYGSTGFFSQQIQGATTGPASGVLLHAGTSSSDYALLIRNALATVEGLNIRGNMTCQIATRLIIPVGVDRWA